MHGTCAHGTICHACKYLPVLSPDRVLSLHSEFRWLNLRCLKEEGSFKVPVRLQPDADMWDTSGESTRIWKKSSTLPLKGHPLTLTGLSEHHGGSGWKRLEKKGNSSKTRLLKRGPWYIIMLHQSFFTPDPGPDAQDEPARFQGLEAISVLSACEFLPTPARLAEAWRGSPYLHGMGNWPWLPSKAFKLGARATPNVKVKKNCWNCSQVSERSKLRSCGTLPNHLCEMLPEMAVRDRSTTLMPVIPIK